MSRNEKLRGRRQRLWNKDPHCYWCKCLTILPPRYPKPHTIPEPNWATIDHLRNRLDDDRLELNPDREERTVLSCWKCNNERSDIELQSVGITAVRYLSNGHPASREKLIEIIQKQVVVIRKLKRQLSELGYAHIANKISLNNEPSPLLNSEQATI